MLEKVAAAAAPDRPRKAERLSLGRINLEMRQSIRPAKHALFIAISLAVGLGLSAIVLMLNGMELSSIFDEFVMATFFDGQGIGAVLVQASQLVLVGLAAALAFRVRFWNIGLEGQIIWGGIGAAFVALFHIGGEGYRLPLMLIAACLCGALWILLPTVLRLRLSVNEIISTLLLNYVAFEFLQHLLYGAWQDKRDGFPHSPQFLPADRLPLLGWERLDWSLPMGLIVAGLAWWLMSRSRFGTYMKFVNANDRMGLAVGVPIRFVTFASVLLSGAIAGAAGFSMVAGQEYRLTLTFWEGYGFSGIVIAFLGRNHPIVVTVIAFLMAGLHVASQNLKVFYSIPGSILPLIEAIIVMAVAGSEFLIRYRVHWVRRTTGEKAC